MSVTQSEPRAVGEDHDPTDHPVTNQLNVEDGWVGPPLSATRVLDEYVGRCSDTGASRPHVLDTQVPVCVGEAVLTSLPLTPLYQYHRETEQTTAWRVGETTQALIRVETSQRTIYMLPPYGETQRDAFWMLTFSTNYGNPFTVTYLSESTVEFVVQMTRPWWRDGTEELLYEHLDRRPSARISLVKE